MFTATFTFAKGDDDEFFALDDAFAPIGCTPTAGPPLTPTPARRRLA